MQVTFMIRKKHFQVGTILTVFSLAGIIWGGVTLSHDTLQEVTESKEINIRQDQEIKKLQEAVGDIPKLNRNLEKVSKQMTDFEDMWLDLYKNYELKKR